MTLELVDLLPSLICVLPDLHDAIATCASEATDGSWRLIGRLSGDERARLSDGCPGDGVAAHGMGGDNIDAPAAVVIEAEDRDIAIGRSACEDGSEFLWCPSDGVDWKMRGRPELVRDLNDIRIQLPIKAHLKLNAMRAP